MRLIKEIGKKLLGNGVVVTIRDGAIAGKKYRMNKYSGLAPFFGNWERDSQRVFEAMVRPGDVVYDLGANTGIHALHFSDLVQADGIVYAVEPMPYNLIELELIKRINHAENMSIIPMAVADKEGCFDFALGDHTKGGSLEMGLDRTGITKVTVTTLDALIGAGCRKPDFLKIDIEGAEGSALEGMSQNIEQSYPSMYIELHNETQDVRVGAFLLKYGYQAFRVRTSQAIRLSQQQHFLKRVNRLDVGHPNPDGLYGCFIAVHPVREKIWRESIDRLSNSL